VRVLNCGFICTPIELRPPLYLKETAAMQLDFSGARKQTAVVQTNYRDMSSLSSDSSLYMYASGGQAVGLISLRVVFREKYFVVCRSDNTLNSLRIKRSTFTMLYNVFLCLAAFMITFKDAHFVRRQNVTSSSRVYYGGRRLLMPWLQVKYNDIANPHSMSPSLRGRVNFCVYEIICCHFVARSEHDKPVKMVDGS